MGLSALTMAGVAYAIQEKKKFFDSSHSFDVALLGESEKSLNHESFPDQNTEKNFQGNANIDWQKMVALSKEISGEILSWENSSHIDVIAKNILTQVDLLTNGKFPDNNILFDSTAENIEYGVADNLVQADVDASVNENYSETNNDILVEFDNFFVDAAKSLLAQNFTDENYIENNVSKSDSNDKKQTKPEDDVDLNNNEVPETSDIQQTIEPVSAAVPVNVAMSSNGIMFGVGLFVAAIAGGGGGSSGSVSYGIGGSSSSSSSSSGSVADGYVEGAFVFFDVDGDQEYDAGFEEFAYTDENGFYQIDNTPSDNYTIVAQGGIDVDSGEVIDVLYAPSDASMVTPLTTLSHFDPNFTIEGYESIDILNYDPIATLDSNASSEEAATILSLGQQVMAVLGSVAEMSSTITGGDYDSAFAEAAESLVDGSYGVSFDQVVNMGDADASDLSTNLGTLVTGSLNAAFSEAGITDTSSISTIAGAVGSGLSESIVKMDAQAVFNGESGALASITQGDMRRDIAELAVAAKSGEDLTSLVNDMTTTYAANAIDSLIVNKVSELSQWSAQKAAAKAAGLNISGDTFKTAGITLEELSSAIVDVISNDSLSGLATKPELVSVRATSDIFEEIRLDLTDIQGEITITVGSATLKATYDSALGLSSLLAELRDQADGLDYSFFSGGGNSQLLMRSDISGDRTEPIAVSVDGVSVIPDIKYSYSTPNVGDSFKIAYDNGGALVVEQTSQLSDLDDYDLISAEIESLLPSGHFVSYDGSNILVTKSDGSSDFDIRWIKSVSNDGGEKLLKASQFFSHTHGTNNSIYSSSVTDDGKVFVSAEYTDEDGNKDYALNTTGRFIYTVFNSNSPDTFAEGLLSVTFNPVSPVVEYNGVSAGIQQLNFDEDTIFDLNVKFDNVGVFGSIFFKDLTNDFTLSYTANGIKKEASYSFSEESGHLHSITGKDVLLLDQNDLGEVTFNIEPNSNLAGNISAFTLVRSEIFGNTSARGQLQFEMDINPIADGFEETTLSDAALIESLELDGSQSDELNKNVIEDQSFSLDPDAVANFINNLQSRMIDDDGSELIAIQIDLPDGLNVQLPNDSKFVIANHINSAESFDIKLAVAVEQSSYFETFAQEFSKIEFFADNDLSGNFTIGLTPKTFESGDINQIKSVETTNFDIFIAPSADAPIINGLTATTPQNAGDGTIITSVSGGVTSADSDGSEEVYLAVSKDDILAISSFAYADFGDLAPLEFGDDNGGTWYRISPPESGNFSFEVIAPDTVASPFSVRVVSLSRDISQKSDGTDYYTEYVFGTEQSARLNYIEYAKLPDFNFLNVADAFIEDEPISLDQIIEIVPVPGKSLDSVKLILDLPPGFGVIGPSGMVSGSGSTFNVTFGRNGQDPYSLSDFSIQTSPHFKEDFSLTINVTDEIPGNSISSDTPLNRSFSVDAMPSGVSGADQISSSFDLPIGAWTNIKNELVKVQPIDATESILVTLVVAGEGNFQVRVTNSEGVASQIISEYDDDINESSFSLTQDDLDSSSVEILPKSTLVSGGVNTVPLRLEIQSVDGGLSEPVIAEVVMHLSDQPLAPDASVSDAQTLEDVAIDLPFAAEVPVDRQGFERVGFELISVPDDFVGGKFTFKVVGDEVSVHEVLAQNGAVILGIPGDSDTFAPIDYATLQFTGPENVSGFGTFQVQVFSEVFGQRTNSPQVDEFSLEIIPQAEVITFNEVSAPNGAEDISYDLGNLLIGSESPLLSFDTGSSLDPSETTLLKLILPIGFELNAGSIVKSDETTITYRVNANDWDQLGLITSNNYSGDIDLSMQITSIDDGDSFVSDVNDITITIDASPDQPYPITLKNSVVSIDESSDGETIASIFGSTANLLVDTDGEVLWINALALGSKTLEFSIDSTDWSDDLSFAATDLENLLVRGFEAEAEKNDFSGEATAQFKTFSKENSQESTKSEGVDLKVIVQPQADGASTSSVSAITPVAISQQDDILSLGTDSNATLEEDKIVSSDANIEDGQVSIKLSDLIGENRAKADDLSEKVFYKIELSNEFNLANIGDAPTLDAQAIDDSGTIEYFVPASSLEKFSIVPNAHVSGDFTIGISVVTRESNGLLSSDQSLGSATLSITPVSDAAILSVTSDLVSFSGVDNAISLPIIVAKRDISESLSLSFEVTSNGSAIDSSKVIFTLDDDVVNLADVNLADLSRVKIHALDDFRGDDKILIEVTATTQDGNADATSVIRPIEISFYKPLDEPTLRFSNEDDFDAGTITNAGNLISGSEQQIGSMLEIPVKGFVDGFDSANYDLSMLISNVPEYVSFWLLKDGEYQQVGTSLSDEGSYSGLWLLSENQLPGTSDHLVMIYDELVLAGDDDEIVDISFNGNLIKFQALATDAEAGTSSVSPAKYLGESEGEINLFEDTTNVSPLQFNLGNVTAETPYNEALKGYLKTAGLLAEADPVIVSFVDNDNDFIADAPTSSSVEDGVTFELDSTLDGGEIPLSWVDNWTVTGALDDNEISLDEVNFAVFTRSDTVTQLSDLYLNIDDLALALDSNGDNYISSDEFLASATQLWVDADRDFEVGEGEILALPEYFDIYLPGQAYEGASTGGLSIIEHADAYVSDSSTSFYPSASGIFGVGIPYASSQAPAGPLSANELLNSSANFQFTFVSEAQHEDISGGFPLVINFTSSVLADTAPNGTMRSDWIKLSISDATGSSVDADGNPIFSIANGIWVVDETNAADSYWIILEESIPASQILNISAPENYKGAISIDAQAMTSLATSNVADETAQTQTVSVQGGAQSLNLSISARADQPLFAVNESIYDVEIKEGEGLDLGQDYFLIDSFDDSENLFVDFIQYTGFGDEPSFTLSVAGQTVDLIQENEYESYYRVAKEDLASLELNLADDEYAGGIYFQVRGVSQDGNDEARTFSEYVYVPVVPVPDVPQGNINGLNISPGTVSEGDEVILDGLTVATGDDNETVYFDIFVKQDGSKSIIDSVDGSLYSMGVVNHDDEYMVPWGPSSLDEGSYQWFYALSEFDNGSYSVDPVSFQLNEFYDGEVEIYVVANSIEPLIFEGDPEQFEFNVVAFDVSPTAENPLVDVTVSEYLLTETDSSSTNPEFSFVTSSGDPDETVTLSLESALIFDSLLTIAVDSDSDSSSDYYLVGDSAGGWNKITDAELNVLTSGTFASETDSINNGNAIKISITVDSETPTEIDLNAGSDTPSALISAINTANLGLTAEYSGDSIVVTSSTVGVSFTIDIVNGEDAGILDPGVTWASSTVDTQITESFSNALTSNDLASATFSVEMIEPTTNSTLPEEFSLTWSATSTDDGQSATLSDTLHFYVDKKATTPDFTGQISGLAINDGETTTLDIAGLINTDDIGSGEILEVEIIGLPTWLTMSAGYIIDVESGVDIEAADRVYRIPIDELDGLEVQALKRNLNGSESSDDTSATLSISLVALEPGSGHVAVSDPLDVQIQVSPVPMTPNITGPKTLTIDEGGVAEFFETVDGELSSKFNIFFGAEDSTDLQSTIRLRLKIEVDGLNSESSDTPGLTVIGASLNEDAESFNYGYYVLSHIDDLKTLSVEFADEQRSGQIDVTIEAYQDFVADSEFVLPENPEDYREFTSTIDVNPVADAVTLTGITSGSTIDLDEGGSFNLSAVSVTPDDSGEAILIQIRVPESFTLTEKVWDQTIGDGGGFALDDNDNELSYIISPNKVVSGVARYTVDSELLALGAYSLESAPYVDGPLTDVVVIRANSVEIDGSSGPLDKVSLSLNISSVADDLSLMTLPPLINGKEDNFFSFGVAAFAFDSDEILEVSFDLLYDDDGDSETTDISLLSIFEINGKQYDGFKIFDPDSIIETEITIDPVTQETYANGQAVSFDPETFTINVENLGTFASGMEIIINGRATGVSVTGSSSSSITLSDDPTQGSGLNEGDQIIFASQLDNFTYKTQPSHWTVKENESTSLNLDVNVASLEEDDNQPILNYKLIIADETLESTDGSWAFSDIQTAYQAKQTNDFYTDLEQVFSSSKVKILDENDNHLATLTLDLLSGEVTNTRMIDESVLVESSFAFVDVDGNTTTGISVEYYDGSVIDPSKEFFVLPPADFVFDPGESLSTIYVKASAISYDDAGDPTDPASYTVQYTEDQQDEFPKESRSEIVIKAATDGPNPIKQVSDTIQMVEDETDPHVVIYDTDDSRTLPENSLVSFADPLESRAIKVSFSDHEFALIVERTIEVTVEKIDGQNKYLFDGVQQSDLELVAGHKYIFDWSGVSTHPLNFSTTEDGTHTGGEAYEDGVIVDGTTTTIIATENTPLLYYYCENHPNMGSGDVAIDVTGGKIENTDGSITYTVLNEIIQDNFNENLDLNVKLIPAKDFSGTGTFNVTSSSKQGIDETKSKTKDFTLDVTPVSDSSNVALNTLEGDGFNVAVNEDTISLTFDEDATVGNPFSLLNFNNLFTQDFAINVTQPVGGIDDHFLDEDVTIEYGTNNYSLTAGFNQLFIASSTNPGELMRYGEEHLLPVELIDVYSDTDFSLSGLQTDGTFSAVSDNLTIGLSEKHAFVNPNYQSLDNAFTSVIGEIYFGDHLIASSQLDEYLSELSEYEMGALISFDHVEMITSLLNGPIEVDLEDLATTESNVNDALNNLTLKVSSADLEGNEIHSQSYSLSLNAGTNVISTIAGEESFLYTSIEENASGLTNYELTISSSDQGEEPVVDTYNLEIAVNRIADATNVFGLFYDNLTSDGVDVVSLYYHPDQDGSESLTVDLYVNDLLGPERISPETNGETDLENGLSILDNSADVLSNNITLSVNSSSTTNLAAKFTAREDVEGYGDVKTGFEESVDESAIGTVVYTDDPSTSDYAGFDGNDLFAGSFGNYHFDGGQGVDKIDLSLLELDENANDISVVISLDDGVIAGGLSYELTSTLYSSGSSPDESDDIFKPISTGSGSSISLITGAVPSDSGKVNLSFENTEFYKATSGDDLIIGLNYQDNSSFALEDSINVFEGGDGDDFILGGDRWEVLSGGQGDDYLEGGRGVDYFYWDGQGNDTVYDFNVGEDKIYLDTEFTGTPTYNSETSTLEFTGTEATLIVNLQDMGMDLIDGEEIEGDEWLADIYSATESGIFGVYQDMLILQNEMKDELAQSTNSLFEPQNGSGFVENYNQTHSYQSFEPQEGSEFVENYLQTHSNQSFEPQDGGEFVEDYLQTHSYQGFEPQDETEFTEDYSVTHSYAIEGDLDALVYDINLTENNEF